MFNKFRLSPPLIWLFIGIVSLAVAFGSVLLTDWLWLDPCPLCIFQRLLFMVIGVLALVAAALWKVRWGNRSAGMLVIASSISGLAVAIYQTWLQLQPSGSVSCASNQFGPIETLVDWLGEKLPDLFLATGFCEDVGFTFLGLSLANWALLAFLACALAAFWLVWLGFRPSRTAPAR